MFIFVSSNVSTFEIQIVEMAELSKCRNCYPLQLATCDDVLIIPTGIASTPIYWSIIDKFQNEWRGNTTSDVDGNVDIDVSVFPDGLFTSSSGVFVFRILSVDDEPTIPNCGNVEMTICNEIYGCVELTFHPIETVENVVPYY